MSDATMDDSAARPKLEIGWVYAGKLDSLDQEAAEQARARCLAFFESYFPSIEVSMPAVRREELIRSLRAEPVVLLDSAVLERNLKRWDYTLVITSSDLIGHYKPDALAAVSRAFESAVLSTARIDPKAVRGLEDRDIRQTRIAHRLFVLAVHCLGHLMGLAHDPDETNAMFNFSTVVDLDGAKSLNDEQAERVEREIVGTTDKRLEETKHRHTAAAVFYAKAAWLNRLEIADAIVQAKPWQFPFRLSRLTAAAFSAMLVLLITAEVWELGTSQSWAAVGLLSTFSVLLTTVYTLVRQRLLARRERKQLSEQNVVTNVATSMIVLGGMFSTYMLLFVTTSLLGGALFDAALVSHWTNRTDLGGSGYLLLSGFIASLGIFIGSLGVSFEQQHYFRHITFVDEEV